MMDFFSFFCEDSKLERGEARSLDETLWLNEHLIEFNNKGRRVFGIGGSGGPGTF
jgi:hypothetical protein